MAQGAVDLRLRWHAFLMASRLGYRRLAAWLIINRGPLTPAQIAYGQALWDALPEWHKTTSSNASPAAIHDESSHKRNDSELR